MAETGALTALGVPVVAAASITYGAPSGAEMGDRLEEAGLSEGAAKGAALGYAVFTGWLESSALGEYIPELAGKGTTSLVKRGYSWLTGKSPETMAKALNRLVSMPVTEGVQEGLEYAAGVVYEGVWQSIAKGDLRGISTRISPETSCWSIDGAAAGAVGTGMRVAGKAAASFKSVEAARAILEDGSATAEAKINARIVNRSDTRRNDNQRLRRFMTRHIDHAFAGRAVDELAGNPEYGLEDAMHYREYHKRCLTGRLADWNGNAIGKSFASMLANNGISVENVNNLV